MQLKIDMHVHSCYSADSVITPKEIVFYANKHGLNGLAITDHNRIDGALKIAAKTDLLVIPGIEIASADGHIIGLNITHPVPEKLSAEETVERIHSAGGIAVACHPFGFLKGGLGNRVSSSFDAIEVINSSSIPFRIAVKKSLKVAARLGKPCLAGSDAHYGPEIGCAYTMINAERNINDVIEAIAKGLCQPVGNSVPLRVRMQKIFEVNKRRLYSSRSENE